MWGGHAWDCASVVVHWCCGSGLPLLAHFLRNSHGGVSCAQIVFLFVRWVLRCVLACVVQNVLLLRLFEVLV